MGQKLTERTELAEAPASGDFLHVVDVSDTTDSAAGTSKKVQAQYLTIADASETVKGKVELATDAETITGTDTARAVTPANIQAKVASDTAKGIVELATSAETITGTDATRAITPAGGAAAYQPLDADLTALATHPTYLTTLNIIPLYAPQGFLINGKISVTDASGITVAIKTLAGTDPSATDPVYVRIGDTVRTITSALSVVKADGTNWMNAGSAELATKEIDYFVYLGYNATDGVVLGFSRYPGANQYSDFSATTTNEKYCAISTITTAAATDYYEVVGRFAATLSAGAGYTWSVPTYTATNLIQRPIYETRWLEFAPSVTAGAGSPTTVTKTENIYKVVSNNIFFNSDLEIVDKGTASSFLRCSLPFTTVSSGYGGSVAGRENGSTGNATCGYIDSNGYLLWFYNNATPWVNGYRTGVNSNYKI